MAGALPPGRLGVARWRAQAMSPCTARMRPVNRLTTVVRSAPRALRASAALRTRGVVNRARRLGIYSAGEGARQVLVPGTTRTVPLYLLAPGATRGLAVQAGRAALVFAATLLTVAAVWASVVVEDEAAASVTAGLTVLSVAVWFVALFAVEWSWASRPRQRPLSADVDRW